MEEIGDWAFAHAEQLCSVSLPRHPMSCGKELFLGCGRLNEIVLGSSQAEWAEYAPLGLYQMLATAVTVFRDYFLLDPLDFGNDAWVKRWDEKLLALVMLDDLDGFEELWTCGEEDYEGKDYDIRSYPVEKRKMKLRIVYFRLMHPYRISDDMYRALREYLRSHTKGTGGTCGGAGILSSVCGRRLYYGGQFRQSAGRHEGLRRRDQGVPAALQGGALCRKGCVCGV